LVEFEAAFLSAIFSIFAKINPNKSAKFLLKRPSKPKRKKSLLKKIFTDALFQLKQLMALKSGARAKI
jgi:hypothetical protein